MITEAMFMEEVFKLIFDVFFRVGKDITLAQGSEGQRCLEGLRRDQHC